MRNYRPKQSDAVVRHGTLRNLKGRLNLDIPHSNPPYFSGPLPNSLNFLAPNTPFPNAKLGKAAKYKGAPLNTSERHGAPRNLAGRLNLAIAHWNLAYFGGFLPNSLNFLALETPCSKTQVEKAGECETTDQTKGRRGTPRNATEPNGTPKCGYAALKSAIFWRIPSEFSDIFGARRPHPNTQLGKAVECETTDQTKRYRGTPRKATGSYGT